MRYLLCKLTDSRAHLRLRMLETVRERMHGLLGSTKDAEPVALCRCTSIHTWGMRYPLDVAFVSSRGEVLKTARNLAPGRMSMALGACYVFERPSSPDPWPTEGSWISLAITST